MDVGKTKTGDLNKDRTHDLQCWRRALILCAIEPVLQIDILGYTSRPLLNRLIIIKFHLSAGDISTHPCMSLGTLSNEEM